MYRNLMSMDVEEMIRAQPMDAAVVIGGCDKTLPAQLMGAANAEVPVIALITGPMMTSPFDGERLGACTDCRRLGEIPGRRDRREDHQPGRRPAGHHRRHLRGDGHRLDHGLYHRDFGMALPGTAAIPAVHADRLRAAEYSGRRASKAAGRGGFLPRQVMTDKAVENALRARHRWVDQRHCPFDSDRRAPWHRHRPEPPQPSQRRNAGADRPQTDRRIFMEDLFAAGGLGAILRELKPLLHLDCPTVAGETLGERMAREDGAYVDRRVVRPFDDPIAARRPGRATICRGAILSLGRRPQPVRG